MDPRAAPGRVEADSGFASLQFVLAAGLGMLIVVALIQLITYQYTRGAALTAAERGVRAASVVGAGEAECQEALFDSLAGVLGGEVGASLQAGCQEGPGVITASVRGTVPGWIVAVPSLDFEVMARAALEQDP